MNVQALNANIDMQQASAMLKEYKQHRDVYDKRDWEIERIYRAISKGKTVISVNDAIVRAGVDSQGRPRLAMCQAHALQCVCTFQSETVVFGIGGAGNGYEGVARVRIPWPGMGYHPSCRALLPRIPPQHRPAGDTLSSYHLLWEADWAELPRDPYLLRRIGKDAWVVLAAWELTDVELSVLRAHPRAQ